MKAACGVSPIWRGVGHEKNRRSALSKECRRLVRVLLKSLTLWSRVAKRAKVRWPGKGPEIKGLEVHSRVKCLLGSCEEVKKI